MAEYAVRLNDRFVARARTVSRVAGVLVMLVGALAFAGWVFDAPLLKGLWYVDITMKANAALALLLAGASLWLLGGRRERAWRSPAGQALALVAGAIGAATLSQHLFGWDLGIDQLLFTEAPGAVATASPGRMGPPASVCLTLAGLALLLLHRGRSAGLAQGAAAGIVFIPLLALTGYAYGAETLYGLARLTGIALPTAAALLVLGVGLLASSADRGLVSVLAGEGPGSVMARRSIVVAFGVPLLLGWGRVLLEMGGYLDARFGIAALVLGLIIVLTVFAFRTAILLNRAEQQHLAAAAAAEREREQLHELEREARADAEAANRAKDEFLAMVSHELRTPLNAILGWASLLNEGGTLDDAAKERALDTIRRNCMAQLQIIEDLLDVSRIISGNLRLDTSRVELGAVVMAAVDVVRPLAETRGIRLVTALDAAGSEVDGDASRLQQVAWNLLGNAVKFSPAGGAVEVRLVQRDGEAILTVLDDGDGIDPALLPHIFDRFRQGDGNRARRQGGLGLGLSIARHLVEMHGGTIEASSDGVGRGACFTVRLPVTSERAAPVAMR